MRKIKKLLIGTLALCMTASMTACNGNGGGKKPNKDGTTDFTLQIYTGGYGADMWKYVVEMFEKDHPEYNVIPMYGNTINETMQDEWRDGNPPDFVYLDGTLEKETWLEEGMRTISRNGSKPQRWRAKKT